MKITNSSDKFFSDLFKNLLLLLHSFANNVTLLKNWVFGNLVDFLSFADLEILQGTFCLIHYGDFLMRPIFTLNPEESYTLYLFLQRSIYLYWTSKTVDYF